MEALSDEQRYPLLTPEAHRFLQSLRQHPHAPAWNHRAGDRLTAEGLARVRAFETRLTSERPAGPGEALPPWLYDFVISAIASVPHYRKAAYPWRDDPRIPADGARWLEAFATIPTTSRADLAAAPWTLVPDDCPLDDLIVYDTSGRTGHPIVVPTHPVVSSMYLPLLRAALAPVGVTLDGGFGRVAIVNVCFQRSTFAFASVSSFLDWAGFAKVNLHESCWREPGDRVRFLDASNPEIYTGDPISLAMLATLPLSTRPKAVVSTSMELPGPVRAAIAAGLGCEVVDLYSLTESGPLAAMTADGYAILRPDVYVEVLDAGGRRCPDGDIGEIVLTGGQNPFFPLLRYRTGDRGALTWKDGQPLLTQLEGRHAMVFRSRDGALLNNVDLAAALNRLRLPRFHLHQHADGRVVVRVAAEIGPAVKAALMPLFGADAEIEIVEGLREDVDGHAARYTSDMPFAIP